MSDVGDATGEPLGAAAEHEAHEAATSELGLDADHPDDVDLHLDVEGLIAELEQVTAERDQFRDQVVRQAADFDNYRKRSARDVEDAGRRAVGRFVEGLLPVLDACDAARQHGQEGAEPIAKALLAALGDQGLAPVGVQGEPFDPTVHEAVMVEAGGDGTQVVAEVLRTGYRWEDRVLRAAMVKVKE